LLSDPTGHTAKDFSVQEVYESKEESNSDGKVIFRRAGKPIGKYWFQLATLSDFKPGRDKCLCTTQTGAVLTNLQRFISYDMNHIISAIPLLRASLRITVAIRASA
jgi:hypothetical protein